MNRVVFGLVAGIAFGAAAVALMLPIEFPDKTTALLAAFASRFAVGFLTPLVELPMPSWATGSIVGLLISVPDAIITKAYAPILVTGVVGGLIIGWATKRFVA